MITNREGTTERSEVSVLQPPLAYSAAQAAAIIGGSCKASWLKAQARSGKIPYLRIGGAYNFSDQHITQIMAIVEHRPTATAPPPASATKSSARRQPSRPTAAAPSAGVTRLKARAPRNLRARPADDQGVT